MLKRLKYCTTVEIPEVWKKSDRTVGKIKTTRIKEAEQIKKKKDERITFVEE